MNSSFCELFGFTSEELIGLPMTKIMPRQFRKNHRKSLLKSINANTDIIIVAKNRLHGCHKNGYIFPINITVRKYLPLGQESQFLGAIELNTQMNLKAHILTDFNFIIESVSECANSLLGLSRKVIKQQKMDLRTFCPILATISQEKLETKKIENATFYLPEYTADELDVYQITCRSYPRLEKGGSSHLDLNTDVIRPSNIEIKTNVTCSLNEFSTYGTIGYCFCFDVKPKGSISSRK